MIRLMPLFLLLTMMLQETTHRTYLPVVTNGVTPCRANRGIAWADGGALSAHALQSCYYYHSTSYLSTDPYALPIIRPLSDRWPIPPRTIANALGAGYSGDLLVMNEPMLEGFTPSQGRDFVNWVTGKLPKARLIGPSIIASSDGFEWLRQYLAIGGLPFDVWGVHIYAESDCSPIECINTLCDIIHCATGNVWVTEIGYDNTSPNCDIFGQWINDLDNDERVSRMFGYTAVNGAAGGRLDMIGDGITYTCTGEAWIE